MQTTGKNRLRIFTIGHSNRTGGDFLELLKEFGIATVVDIRRYPASRKFPHFNREKLEEMLKVNNINYLWFEALGGRRHSKKNIESKNTALKNPAFRNYADYMTTKQFHDTIDKLRKTAALSTVAIMCAEALYWRCHRKLVSDYLTLHNVEVKHILEHGKLLDHNLTTGATVAEDGAVIYPSQPDAEWLFDLYKNEQ